MDLTATQHPAHAAIPTDLLSVLLAIAAAYWLIRWALLGLARRVCATCRGSGVHRGFFGDSPCHACGGTGRPPSLFR